MKLLKVSAFFISFVLCSAAVCQNLHIEESEPLKEEPGGGWLKLLQLSTGSTALVHITEKDGIQLWVYDSTRSLKLNKVLEPKFDTKGKIRAQRSTVNGALTIKNEVVIFISIWGYGASNLHRIIINTDTGTFREDQIYDDVSSSGVFVRKDENSDHYGLALHYKYGSDPQKKLRLVHFDSDHKIIHTGYVVKDEFKIFKPLDLLVVGDRKLSIYVTGHNSDELDEGAIFFGSLEKGKPEVIVKKLPFTENQHFPFGMLRYDKHKNQIVMLALKQNVGSQYSPMFMFFDADTYTTLFYKTLNPPDVNKEYQKIFGEDKDFNALPQTFHINDDDTYTLVYEELKNIIAQHSSGAVVGSSSVLGSMAVSILNNEAKEIHSELIPKEQFLTAYYPPLYLASRKTDVEKLTGANHFKSFSYANANEGKYLFFNDVVENLEKVKNGKITRLMGISDSDAFVCNASTKTRSLLFGHPPKKAHNFAMFTVSDYNPQSGIYATVKVEYNRNKKTKITWIRLK